MKNNHEVAYGTLKELAYYYHESKNHSSSYDYNYKAGREAYSRGDIDDSIKCFSRAIEDAEILQDDRHKMEVYWRLGRDYIELGMFKEASDLNMISIIYYILNDKRKAASVSEEIASVYKNKGNYEIALSLYYLSLSLVKELNYQLEVSMRLHDIGQIHQYRGNYDKALDFFDESIRVRKAIRDKPGCAWGLYEIGVTYRLLGKYSNGLDSLQKSERIFKEIADMRGLAWVYQAKGYIYYRTDDPSKTLELYEKSLAIYEKSEETGSLNYLDKATVLHDIGSVYLDQGNIEQAMSNFDNALKIRKALGDKIGISRTQEYRAKTYRLKGNNNESINLYEDCLQMKENLDDKRGIARVYNGLASNYLDLNEMEKSMEFFQKNLEISEKIEDERGIALALYGQALISIAKKDFDSALELLYKCEKLQMDLHEDLQIADTLAELGYVHFELGNVDEAKRYFDKARPLFKKFKAEPRLARINRYTEVLDRDH